MNPIKTNIKNNPFLSGVIIFLVGLVVYLVKTSRKTSQKVSQTAQDNEETRAIMLTMMSHTNKIEKLDKDMEEIKRDMKNIVKKLGE